jgi:hypothetical protein
MIRVAALVLLAPGAASAAGPPDLRTVEGTVRLVWLVPGDGGDDGGPDTARILVGGESFIAGPDADLTLSWARVDPGRLARWYARRPEGSAVLVRMTTSHGNRVERAEFRLRRAVDARTPTPGP